MYNVKLQVLVIICKLNTLVQHNVHGHFEWSCGPTILFISHFHLVGVDLMLGHNLCALDM